MIRRPPRSPLFPSPTLSRSRAQQQRARRGEVISVEGASPRRREMACGTGADRAGVRIDGSEFGGQHVRLLEMPAEQRSEQHTSELQSRQYLVCRLLLEKKNT